MDFDRLRRQLTNGGFVDLRTGDPEADDPANVNTWGTERQVPAELLTEVLTTPLEQAFDEGPVSRRVTLFGARITGTLDLNTALVPRAVRLLGCFFDERPTVVKADLVELLLTGCRLPGLDADGARIHHDLVLSEGFVATGEVRLLGTQVAGQLTCEGGGFHNPDGIALNADRLAVEQSMYCARGFVANGEVRLVNARVGGQFNCQDGTFHNPGGAALTAHGLTVEQSMYCTGGFSATGEFSLVGTHIGDQFNCEGGSFHNPGGTALAADALTVGQSMYCTDGFTANGEVSLISTAIAGPLDCGGGAFHNPAGTALTADRLTVEQTMNCNDGFTANGEVRLVSARIGGQFNCRDGTFHHPEGTALTMQRAEIRTDVFLEPAAFEGEIDLVLASVGGWVDNELVREQPVELHGFRYTTIGPRELPTRSRLEWLGRNVDDFDPQPYEQLASVYAGQGAEEAARQVQIAKQRRRRARRRHPLRRWPGLAWSAFLRATIGYGYRPWFILWWLFGLLAGGTWLFGREHAAGRLVPTGDASGSGGADEAGRSFDAFRYSMDLLLPVIGLREDAAYAPVGHTAWYTFGYTCAGWLLALVLVAGLTGVFKRSQLG